MTTIPTRVRTAAWPRFVGDGHIQADVEECDDGNEDEADDCRSDCRLTESPTCGNGNVDAGEFCFGEVVNFPTILTPVDIDSGDVDGDGHVDVVVGVSDNSAVRTLIGDGTGNFTLTSAKGFNDGGNGGFGALSAIALGDHDGNDVLDIAATGNPMTGGRVSVLFGTGNQATPFDNPDMRALTEAVLDVFAFDESGDEDFEFLVTAPMGTTTIYEIPYQATLTSSEVDFSPSYVGTGNIDGDDFADFVFTDRSAGQIVITDDDQTTMAMHDVTSVNRVLVAEVTGDDKDDIVLSEWNSIGCPIDSMPGDCSDSRIVVVPGVDELAELATTITVFAGKAPQSLAVADFDSNGFQDIAVVNAVSGTITIREGSAEGDFYFSRTLDVKTPPGVTELTIGDFNEDGVADFAVSSAGLESVQFIFSNP